MSLRLKLVNFVLRNFERRALRKASGPEEIRRRMRVMTSVFFRPPIGTSIRAEILSHHENRVGSLKIGEGTGGVLLYLHGGAYVFGSAHTHRKLVAKLAADNGLTAYSVSYRRAPEHPFPAAIDDAFTAYQALLDKGIAPRKIIVAGDSAGGGLALALLHRILDKSLPKPRNLIAFSPFTDQTLTSDSLVENAECEAMLPVERIEEMRAMYLAGGYENPLASPLFGAFTGAPPVFLCVGTTEILRDDTILMAKKLRASGVDVTIDIGENLPHVWPFFHGFLPEANATLKRVQAFLSHPSP